MTFYKEPGERGLRIGSTIIAAYVKRTFDGTMERAVVIGTLFGVVRSSMKIQGKQYVRWSFTRRALQW